MRVNRILAAVLRPWVDTMDSQPTDPIEESVIGYGWGDGIFPSCGFIDGSGRDGYPDDVKSMYVCDSNGYMEHRA